MEICIKDLAKVEGHASLVLCMDEEKGKVTDAHLDIYESPRYFENIVKGRRYNDLPLVTSRICGMCSYSHTLGSLRAIENAFNVVVSEQTEKLRMLLMYGTIIQSHALHLGFLTLPDYIGVESILDIASKDQALVKRILKLRDVGENMMKVIGGRNIHTISSRIGGFSQIPTKVRLEQLEKTVKAAREHVLSLFEMYCGFVTPKFERRTSYMALTPGVFEGTMRGIAKYDALDESWDLTTSDNYLNFVKEFVVPYSTAKYSVSEGYTYMVGALARLNINHRYLSDGAKELLDASPISAPCHSPYANNLCQCIELVHCIERSAEIIEDLMDKLHPDSPVEIVPRDAEGVGVVEVPRGILFHHYTFDNYGNVAKADIITPTSQNLYNIEADIRQLAPRLIDEGRERLTLEIEKLIRAYDPCISCATHFLNVEIKKTRGNNKQVNKRIDA